MGAHPLNLAIRFLLELTALASAGYWGWKTGDGFMRLILAIGIPLVLAVIWGTFNVPGDPSRSGQAPVVTPGMVRLLIEFAVLGFGAWTMYQAISPKAAVVYGVVEILHYAVSYDRIAWLLSS